MRRMSNITLLLRSIYGFRALVALLFFGSMLTHGQVEHLVSSQKIHEITKGVLLGTMPALVLSSTFNWKDG